MLSSLPSVISDNGAMQPRSKTDWLQCYGRLRYPMCVNDRHAACSRPMPCNIKGILKKRERGREDYHLDAYTCCCNAVGGERPEVRERRHGSRKKKEPRRREKKKKKKENEKRENPMPRLYVYWTPLRIGLRQDGSPGSPR